MTSQLDIIVVSYNTAELTLRALKSVYDETRETAFNLIVVDNNSHDDSADKIEQAFPQLSLIRSESNLGFSGGVNLGAQNSVSEYILLLNPDTVIIDSAIDKLMTFAHANPANHIWGGVTLNHDLSLNTHNAWSRPDTLTLLFSALGLSKLFSGSCFFNHANYGCWQRDTVKEVDMLQGCFFLTTRSLWDRLGGLDETFFMYGEESDYCLKAIDLGFQPVVTPSARIIHHGGASETHLSGKMVKLMKGKVELVNRHSPRWLKPLHRGLLYGFVLNKYLSFSVLSLLKAGNKQAANEWRAVFKQRHEWMKGWGC